MSSHQRLESAPSIQINHISNYTVFVVSTMGQARNAVELSNVFKYENPLFFVLYTKRTPQVIGCLNYLKSHDHIAIPVALPLKPNSGRPTKVRKIYRIYSGFLDKFSISSIWIANSNSHYAMLAKMCCDRGIQVSFFEDGLGTYKTYSEIITYKSLQTILVEMFRGIWGQTKKLVKNFVNFLTSLKRIFLECFFALRWVRAICYYVLPNPYSSYYSIHKNYDNIIVSFPDKLDEKIFRGNKAKFDIAATFASPHSIETLEKANFYNTHTSDCDLYISQVYGSGQETWYCKKAEVLANLANTNMLIKFHPKENFERREYFIQQLKDQNLDIVDVDPLNIIDVNALIFNYDFKRIIGLTSSSLIYGREYHGRQRDVISVAPELLRKIKSSATMQLEYTQLKKDYRIFSNFLK